MGVKLILVIATFVAAAESRVPSFLPHVNGSSMVNHSHNPQVIPGTELKTRTFYKLALKGVPQGVVTYAQPRNSSTVNYVQVDANPGNQSNYQQGGEYHQDAMWEFIPVLQQGQETGWYGLTNRGIRGAYITWSPKTYVDNSNQVLSMIVENNYPGDRVKADFFLKPVKVQQEGQVQSYYQLKLKNLPEGVVTLNQTQAGYANQGYQNIQVDNNTDQVHMINYQQGGKWYDSTLFTIDSPEMETQQESEMVNLQQ